MSDLLADVAVDAFTGVEPVFTYRVPARLRAEIRPGRLVWGLRVQVDLGAGAVRAAAERVRGLDALPE